MILVAVSPPRPAPAPPVASDWGALSVWWEGWDGSVWDLNDRAGGVMLLREEVEGLHNPQVTREIDTNAAVHGHRVRAWTADAREVYWPIFLFAGNTVDWLARSKAFWSTIHPDRPGTWRVRAGSEERTLRLKAVFGDPHRYPVDPLHQRWAKYGVTLEAEQPFWCGVPITAGPWSTEEGVEFFPDDGAPDFGISGSTAFGDAVISNPGDVDAYGVAVIDGPLDDVEIGVGSAVIHVPFPVPDGETLRIDTDPLRPTATMGGLDVTRDLGLQEYAPVPPGRSVPLHVMATGTGSIRFTLTPLYFRAFA